jgi:hypothetical protein
VVGGGGQFAAEAVDAAVAAAKAVRVVDYAVEVEARTAGRASTHRS